MKLTERITSPLGPQATDLIHIVKTGDTSQNSAGSSYKIEMGDYKSVFPNTFVTGGTYSNGSAIFTNNTGGVFTVSGFVENLQKTITSSYTLTALDNNYSIMIDNGGNQITITVPTGLPARINIGFIQQGSGDITISGSGTTIRTPLTGAFKIKGQNYNAYLEQVGSSNVYQLLGNLKV